MDTEILHVIIDSITKWGLEAKIDKTSKIAYLKKSLIVLYGITLDISYTFDETDYPDCPDFDYNIIRKNIINNFPDFGLYNSATYSPAGNESGNILGDAIDDLSDIIKDLLEVKWRIEYNGINDGLWFLSFTFESHSEQHLLDLLNYIKNK